MAEPKIINPEVLPPEAQNMHPFNKPVQFNMQNTLQSPLFWTMVGAISAFALQHYWRKHNRSRD